MTLSRQSIHLGLQRAKFDVLNGIPSQHSEMKYGSFLGYQSGSNPDVWECMSKLHFEILDPAKDFIYLKRFISASFLAKHDGCRINIGKILRARGYTKDYPYSSIFTLPYFVSPKIMAACLIVNKGRSDITPEVLKFAARVEWEVIPALVKVNNSTLYRVHSSPDLVKSECIQSFLKVKKLATRERKGSSFVKPKYVEATNETNSFLSSGIVGQVFSTSLVDLILEPINNRGYAVCNVVLFRKDRGTTENIGQIRNIKGKLYFSSPMLLTSDHDKCEHDRMMKEKQLTKIQFDRRSVELKDQIKNINLSISELKIRLKGSSSETMPDHAMKELNTVRLRGSSCTKLAFQLADLERQKYEIETKLSSIFESTPDLRSGYHRLDSSLIPSVLILFDRLGLKPNNFLRSMPIDSPIASLDFWESHFWVKCDRRDHTCPILFLQDKRKGSTSGKIKR